MTILTAREQRQYRAWVVKDFEDLQKARLIPFPDFRKDIDAPDTQGVYIIYGPYNRVLHVGKSARGKEGLLQRMRNHWDGRSSFVTAYLKRDPTELRENYRYRYLEVEDPRRRALLESYTTAALCPLHLGLGDKQRTET